MAPAELSPNAFFDLSHCFYNSIFEGTEIVWEALNRVPSFIETALKTGFKSEILGTVSPLAEVGQAVYIGPGSVVEAGVTIKDSVIIGAGCEIRSGAYIRENVLIGDQVVVGHATELKHCLLFNQVQVPHFNYVGDSILGWRVHLGAGVKISNVKISPLPIRVTFDGQVYKTGLKKFGAVLGDEVEIGCNSVLNPGTLVGKQTLAYPNLSLFGYYPPHSIIKLRQQQKIVTKKYHQGDH